MVIIGIDAHMRSHALVVCDEQGRKLAQRSSGTTSSDHLALLAWVVGFDRERLWAVEDCRHLWRRLERDLLLAGERIVRVPPKLMAHARDGARAYGTSDAIDVLAVARAALREPSLPAARLDGQERELRLLVDHREDLVAERTRVINRLRWHLHELDAEAESRLRSLNHLRVLERLAATLEPAPGLVARLARELLERCRQLTVEIRSLQEEIAARVCPLAPSLLAIHGCGALTAAKILGETAGITRFHSAAAYARHNGSAPLPVSSASRDRHRLGRTGNRQLNAALHRIAVSQAHWHAPAQAMIARRTATGDTPRQARRLLKRRLSDVVYRALKADLQQGLETAA